MGSVTIFSGNFAKFLKQNLNLNDQTYILTGTVDPTVTATTAPVSSIYMNTSSGKVYLKKDAGNTTNWSLVFDSSTTNESNKNYIINPSASSSIAGWTSSNPANLTVVRTTIASELPRENTTKSGIKILATSNDETGVYVYTDFTLDDVDLNRVLTLKFDVKVIGAYTGKLSAFIAPQSGRGTPIAGSTSQAILTSDGTFSTTFVTDTTAALSLVIIGTGNETNATGICISDVVVGPGQLVSGAAVGNWTSYTPTITGFGAPANVSCSWLRVGGAIALKVKFDSGTPESAPALEARISLPPGLTSAYTNTLTMIGAYARNTSSATANQVYVENGVSYVTMGRADGSNNGLTKANGNIVAVAGDTISFTTMLFPVNELSSNVYLSPEGVEFASNSSTTDADDTTSFVQGPQGSSTPGALTADRVKRVQFLSAIQPNDLITIEFARTQSGPWTPVSSGNATTVIPQLTVQNGVFYGVGWTAIDSTHINVYFARYAYPSGATYGAAGGTWSTSLGYWRVRKASSGALAGFNVATTSQPVGLLKAGEIPGATDGLGASIGNVGQVISSGQGTTTSSTSGPTDVATITLTPGSWRVTAMLHHTSGGGSQTGFECGISEFSGSSSSWTLGVNAGSAHISIATPAGATVTIPPVFYNVAFGTSKQLWLDVTAFGQGNTVYGSITAERIR